MLLYDKIESGKRLVELQNRLSINSRQFALSIGADPSYLSKMEKGEKGISPSVFKKIEQKFDVNKDWLYFGKGEIFGHKVPRGTSDEGQKEKYNRQAIKLNTEKNRIPFYDAAASGGIVETEMSPIHAPAGTIDVGDLLHDSQAAIRIYGNSMIPNYPPGCVVGLTRVTNSFIEPGEVYVIETVDMRILKRLFYKDDDPDSEYITCYSDNIMNFEGGSRHGKAAYPPFNLMKEEIKNIFIVTGVIKRNSNSVIINRKP